MIGKVPKPGKGFRGLVSYLMRGDRKKPRDKNRVAWVEARNLLIDDPDKVPALMRATAARSKRVKNPVYHYVISWHRDEAPTDKLMREVADTTCKDLGLSEYQALYIAHKDTAHRHVHIVVNRVHPETHRAWKASHDYRRIEQSLRRQAEDMGLDYVPGPHNDPERFREERRQRRPKNPTYQKERRLGRTPGAPATLSEQRRTAFLLVYQNAENWQQFEAGLAALGLRFEGKGQGAVVIDGDNVHKLSAFSKSTRLKDLQKRFGQSLADHRSALPPEPEEPGAKREREAYNRAELAGLLHKAELIGDEQLEQQRAQHAELADVRRRATLQPAEDSPDYISYLAYRNAAAAADFAFALYNFRLIDEKQLARAARERDRAQSALDNYQPTVDQLTVDATKALFGSPKEKAEADRRLASSKTTRRAHEQDGFSLDDDFEPDL